MVIKPDIEADLLITRGDDVIGVRGQGDVIEVEIASVRFLLRHSRNFATLTFQKYEDLNDVFCRFGFHVVIKTKYFSAFVLGQRTKKWVKYVIKFILPG
jgi:hypothetical protein